MKTRIITGVALFAAVLVIFFVDSYMLNFAILGFVLYTAFSEAQKLYGLQGSSLALVAVIFYLLTPFSNPVFIAILAVLLVVSFLAHFKSENLTPALPFLYPMTPIFLIWMLYSLYGVDSGAFFVGKFYGKHAFSETSPNKTWEGVAGGIAVATVFGAGFGWVLTDSFWHSLITAFLVAVFGVWGDLFESYLKRRAGVKDSGTLLPGHGGMLDRVDGYLFGVAAMLWTLSW